MDSLPIPTDIQYGWIILILLGFTLSRYLLLPGLSYFLFYCTSIQYFKKYKIQSAAPPARQLSREIRYSASTILMFTLTGTIVYCLYKNGYTTIYTDIDEHGWQYFLFTLLLMVFMHDTYFYWTHRLLHTRWMFRKIHKVHHRSSNPTPLTAYAFHPLEAFIESLIVFPFITIFPVHIFAFTLFTFLVLLMNVIGHLGYEFISPAKRRHPVGKLFTSSTHHNLHHQKTHRNFGYYFTFWDRIMKTLQSED